MSRLDADVIQSALEGHSLGKKVWVFDAVGSTNETALGLAREEAPEGTVVLANLQWAGQGRWGLAGAGCHRYLGKGRAAGK